MFSLFATQLTIIHVRHPQLRINNVTSKPVAKIFGKVPPPQISFLAEDLIATFPLFQRFAFKQKFLLAALRKHFFCFICVRITFATERSFISPSFLPVNYQKILAEFSPE